MTRTVAYRSLYALVILLIASFAVFYGMRLAPGDVADVLASHPTGQLTVERVREDLGLNKPILVQYATYMGKLLRGDLGLSLINGQPILTILESSAGYTLKLAAVAALLSRARSLPRPHVRRPFARLAPPARPRARRSGTASAGSGRG